MKKGLAHLPLRKRQELGHIVERIREKVDGLAMIILFGSHTGDGWVEDVYTEGHITYEYRSDFDILVIVETNKIANSTNLWYKLDKSINAMNFRTPTTIIAHDIDYVNRQLERSQYFFSDIKKQGIMLYDSGKFKLARSRKLDPTERAQIAQDDFKQWMKTAKEFLIDFNNAFERRSYKKAAFELHQATEALFHAVLLVFTGYKPKSHDLKKLTRLAANHNPEFFKIFPFATKEQREIFDLLNRAYVDARYKKDYKISKAQLEYLAERVKKLQRLTNKVCKEKIKVFAK